MSLSNRNGEFSLIDLRGTFELDPDVEEAAAAPPTPNIKLGTRWLAPLKMLVTVADADEANDADDVRGVLLTVAAESLNLA